MPQGDEDKSDEFSMQNLLMLSAQKPGPTACLDILYKTVGEGKKIHDWTLNL